MELPKLIVLDLDGTLLPESKCISRRTIEVLSQMERRGASIAIATGKFLHLARGYGEELGLTTPMIALDGARIEHKETANGRRSIEERGIPRDTAIEILDRYIDPSWDVFADDGADDLLLRSQRLELERITRFWASSVRRTHDVQSSFVANPAILVAYGPDTELRTIAGEIETRYPELRISLFWSEFLGCHRITVQPARASKGDGVLAVIDRLDLQPGDCMVFGDWLNDLPMFAVGCVNVAMRNAVPELKAEADHTTEWTSEDDGVARFLEDHFLSPRT